MTFPYEYSPYIWPMLASAVFLGALAAYAWRHRTTPGAIAFAWSAVLVGLWAIGNTLEMSTPDLATRVFWLKVQMALSLYPPVTVVCFILEYAGLGRWLSRRNLALLFAPAVAITPIYFVDASLLWTPVLVDGVIRRELTPLALVPNLYSMSLLLLSLAVIAFLFVRSPLHRKPAALILLGHLGPILAAPLEALNIVSAGPLDLAVLGCDFAFSMYAIAMFRYRLFDVVPVARESVLERMADAMVVLDAENRVAELNPAAQELLGVSRSRVLGRQGAVVLESFPDLAQLTCSPDPAETEILMGEPAQQRWYQVSCSPLVDRRGFQLGRLLMLHDITQLKNVRERLLQQERALATVEERERVARELHDSIGQVLGYVSLQVDATRKLLEDGKADVADAQLARLAEVARDAHADVRGYILDLRAAPSERRPFFATLSRYLDGFTQNYGIQTSLAVSPDLEEGAFGPEEQAHLLRIIQEAVSNARKHGAARNVRVALESSDRLVRVAIQDDGCGFDPAGLSPGEGNQFGLQFMRERADGLGGRVELHAAPGEGTRVVVEMPLSGTREDAQRPPLSI